MIIDNNGSAVRDSKIVFKDAKHFTHCVTSVRDHGMSDLIWKDHASCKPGIVPNEGIRADADNGNIITFKFFQQLLETVNFRRSYEGKVEGIEIQNVPLSV